MSKKAKGIALIVVGFIMVLAATAWYAMVERQDVAAGQNADVLLYELNQDIGKPGFSAVFPEKPAEDTAGETSYPAMATADHNGLEMIGIIRVPSCGIELPVLSDWSYELLEYAPCRYSGNIYAGDLILMGHNYSSHFKPLKSLVIGDTVEFTDVSGSTWVYTVGEIDTLHKSESDLLFDESYQLTLFTCSNYGVYRFVARCSLVEVVESPE